MRRSGQPPGADVSILKIKGTEIQQALTELMMEAVGPYALPFSPERERRRTATSPTAGARAALLQLPQDDDLRRARTRSSATSSRRWCWGCRRHMDFDFNEEQQLLPTPCGASSRKEYGFEARKAIVASKRGLESGRSGRSSPRWACSACRSRRTTAASAAARST